MKQNNRLVLVTGGTGYVGSVLVPALARKYHVRTYDSQVFGNAIAGTPNVEAMQGDIRNTERLDIAVRGATDVIHLAGIVTDELVDMNPRKARSINLDSLMTLLALCDAHKVQRFVLMSSSSIYGNIKDAKETDQPQPLTEYARQKLQQETLVRANGSLMPATIIRSATLCGPAPRMRLDTIVNIFCKQAWFDDHITVFGGQQLRTNVHVDDLVGFYLWLLDQPVKRCAGQTFNITTANHSALALAQLVARIHGTTRIEIDPVKVDHRSYSISATKAVKWGWRPRRSIEDAIEDNYAWFKGGRLDKPNADLHYNNRRMALMMRDDARTE